MNINTLQILEKIDEKPISSNEISKQFEEQIENLDETIQSLLKYGWLKEKDLEIYLSIKGKEKLLLFQVILEQESYQPLPDRPRQLLQSDLTRPARTHPTQPTRSCRPPDNL